MSNTHPRVLHVTENRFLSTNLGMALRRRGCTTYVQLHSAAEVVALLECHPFPEALFDLYLIDSGCDGIDEATLARQIRVSAPGAPIFHLRRRGAESRMSSPTDHADGIELRVHVSNSDTIADTVLNTFHGPKEPVAPPRPNAPPAASEQSVARR